MLDASNSFDPDGESVSYEWTTPSGNTISEQTLSVSDLDPESRYSSCLLYTSDAADEL